MPPETSEPINRHVKSTSNPDWPYERYCVGCGQEWPCDAEIMRRKLEGETSEVADAD